MTVWDSLQFEREHPLIEDQSKPLFYEDFPSNSTISTGYALYRTQISSAQNPILSNLRAALSPNMTRAQFYFNHGHFGQVDLQETVFRISLSKNKPIFSNAELRIVSPMN